MNQTETTYLLQKNSKFDTSPEVVENIQPKTIENKKISKNNQEMNKEHLSDKMKKDFLFSLNGAKGEFIQKNMIDYNEFLKFWNGKIDQTIEEKVNNFYEKTEIERWKFLGKIHKSQLNPYIKYMNNGSFILTSEFFEIPEISQKALKGVQYYHPKIILFYDNTVTQVESIEGRLQIKNIDETYKDQTDDLLKKSKIFWKEKDLEKRMKFFDSLQISQQKELAEELFKVKKEKGLILESKEHKEEKCLCKLCWINYFLETKKISK